MFEIFQKMSLPEHDPHYMRLHPVWSSPHLMTQTVQSVVSVRQAPLADHGPQEPREGALLAVPLHLGHCLGTRQFHIRPDTCSIVDEDTCQLNAGV